MANIEITKEVDAVLDHEIIAQPIDVVQWDSGVTIVLDVRNFTIPTGTTATCYTRKPSGLGVYQEDLTVDVSQNKVTIPVSNQALAEYGLALLQVKLHLGNTVLSSFLIPLNVVISLQDDSADRSRHVVPPFDQALADAIARIRSMTDNITIDTETGTITIPTALPNPHKLKFTGAVSGQYDGSEELTVNIPVQQVPTSLKNPYPLTFTGGTTGSYDGSQAKTVNIPTALKNPQALTFAVEGAAIGSYDGSVAKTLDIPSSLKNPNALRFTGAATGQYDGSAPMTVNIPTTGACEGTLTFTGAVSASYNGSSNVTVNIPQGGGSGENTGGTIDMRRVRFVDSRQGVDRNNMNQDLTTILQGLIDELYNLGGGAVVFGGGTYKCQYLNMKSKVSLIGIGRGITILTKIPGSTPHGAFIYFGEDVCLSAIRGMTLMGPAAQDATYKDNGTPTFWLSNDTVNVYGIKIDDVSTDSAPNPWIEFASEGHQAYTTSNGTVYAMAEGVPRTYKNITIHDVIVSCFGLSGYYVGVNCFSVYIDNSVAYANRGHGFEIHGTDCYYTLLHAEKNGHCGLYANCANCKFVSMKLIWNGFIDPQATWVASEYDKGAGHYKNYGLFARANRSTFSLVETQDNYAGGVFIDCTQAQFDNVLIDAGGYRDLGRGADACMQIFDALTIVNSNNISLSAQMVNYKKPHKSYRNAVVVDWLTESIVDLIIAKPIALNVSALANDNNLIKDNLIRCTVWGD